MQVSLFDFCPVRDSVSCEGDLRSLHAYEIIVDMLNNSDVEIDWCKTLSLLKGFKECTGVYSQRRKLSSKPPTV